MDTTPKTIALILYLNLEDFEIKENSYIKYNEENDSIIGYEQDKESFYVKINGDKSNQVIIKSFQRYRKRYEDTWRVKKFISEELKKSEISSNSENIRSKNKKQQSDEEWNFARFQEPNKISQANIIAVQLVLKPPFKINVNFDNSKLNLQKSEDLDHIIAQKQEEFHNDFHKNYNLTNDFAFIKTEADQKQLEEMSKQALSNLLGGIGFYYGKININLEETKDGKWHKGFRYAVEKKGLLTGSPSRSFFARGFLWDEGFHNIIISQWNPSLSMDIIDSWLSTMSATGWMAREQIRGKEAEAQVPEKFIQQDKLIANPPTFIFPIENIIKYYKTNFETHNELSKLLESQMKNKEITDEVRKATEEKLNTLPNIKSTHAFLKKCFDKLAAWFEWFEIYQKSPGDQKTYQWYGRNSEHNLASGLDDFPRGMLPNIYERHLDLHIWVIELLHTLRNLSHIYDFDLVDHFEKMISKMKENLFSLYFDKSLNILNDYLGPQFNLVESDKHNRLVPPYFWRGDGKCGAENLNPLGKPAECNPYSDMPCCSEWGWCGNSTGHCNCDKCHHAKKLEDRRDFDKKESIFNPHIGYVNLFPIIFGYLNPDEGIFKATLEFLQDSNELYSNFGIRSLSKSDLLYHTGEDYWRGNIWINLNFLVLRGLYKFYKNIPEADALYKNLRSNLVKAVFEEWKKTKMFYEQYSDKNGRGQRAHPFNGWTSLILNIIAERYDN